MPLRTVKVIDPMTATNCCQRGGRVELKRENVDVDSKDSRRYVRPKEVAY